MLLLALWVWAIFDVITTPDKAQRNLPKIAWVFIVLLFWAIGALAWIVLGRPKGAPVGFAGRSFGRWGQPSDARDDAAHLSDQERLRLERREYYKRMDEELDRRLEEKRRRGELGDTPDAV